MPDEILELVKDGVEIAKATQDNGIYSRNSKVGEETLPEDETQYNDTNNDIAGSLEEGEHFVFPEDEE